MHEINYYLVSDYEKLIELKRQDEKIYAYVHSGEYIPQTSDTAGKFIVNNADTKPAIFENERKFKDALSFKYKFYHIFLGDMVIA